MRCETCGTPLDRPGQAHLCQTDRTVPSPAAETFSLASRRVVRFGVVYAVVVAIINALALAGYAAAGSGAAAATKLSAQGSVLIVAAFAGLVALVCVIGLLVSTVVWIVSAHRLTATGPGTAGYSGLVLCFLLIALAYVLPPWMPTVSGAVAADVALRIGGLALLVTGVLLARARIRRETGQANLGGKRPLITSDDWDASKWDPEVSRDIPRRRGATS